MTTTTTCPTCGQANEPGEAFCGACGAYLEWDDAAAPAPAPAAPAAPAPAPAPTTTVPAESVTPETQPANSVPAQTVPANSVPDAGPPVPARVDDARDAPAAAAPAPSGEPAPSGGEPEAVLPGVPRPRPAPRRAETQEPEPDVGDLVCGACGAGNVPTRHFCRRCGASLADARVQGRRSWWQRLWHPEPRTAPTAGTRPRRRRRFPTKTVVTLVVLAGLGVAAYALRGPIGDGVVTVRDRLQGNEVYNPVAVRASSEAPERPASQIVDGTNDLAWSPAEPGDGVGQSVVLTFDQPFRLVHLVVSGGTSTVQEEYLQGSSPRALDVTVTRSDGTTAQQRVTLDDVPGPQEVEVGQDDVASVRLTIVSTFRATPETRVAVAEVEFRGRS